MKCPLLAIAWSAVVAQHQEAYPECFKEECAWWDKLFEQCALISIAHHLWTVRGELSDIRDKMPHEEQFRK